MFGGGIGVRAEIAVAHELPRAARRGGRLHKGVLQHGEGIRQYGGAQLFVRYGRAAVLLVRNALRIQRLEIRGQLPVPGNKLVQLFVECLQITAVSGFSSLAAKSPISSAPITRAALFSAWTWMVKFFPSRFW